MANQPCVASTDRRLAPIGWGAALPSNSVHVAGREPHQPLDRRLFQSEHGFHLRRDLAKSCGVTAADLGRRPAVKIDLEKVRPFIEILLTDFETFLVSKP